MLALEGVEQEAKSVLGFAHSAMQPLKGGYESQGASSPQLSGLKHSEADTLGQGSRAGGLYRRVALGM